MLYIAIARILLKNVCESAGDFKFAIYKDADKTHHVEPDRLHRSDEIDLCRINRTVAPIRQSFESNWLLPERKRFMFPVEKPGLHLPSSSITLLTSISPPFHQRFII